MSRAKQFWLMKSEPIVFSFDDLKARPRSTDHWEGVRNTPELSGMKLLQKRQCLSVLPATKEEFAIIRSLGMAK